MMIHVVAVLTAKLGHRAALLSAFKSIVPAVHAEPGCIEYQAAIDLENSPVKFGADAIVVIEKWKDQEALGAHSEGVTLKDFHEKTKHLVAQADTYLLESA